MGIGTVIMSVVIVATDEFDTLSEWRCCHSRARCQTALELDQSNGINRSTIGHCGDLAGCRFEGFGACTCGDQHLDTHPIAHDRFGERFEWCNRHGDCRADVFGGTITTARHRQQSAKYDYDFSHLVNFQLTKVIIFRRNECDCVRWRAPSEKICKKVKKFLTSLQHFGTLERLYRKECNLNFNFEL